METDKMPDKALEPSVTPSIDAVASTHSVQPQVEACSEQTQEEEVTQVGLETSEVKAAKENPDKALSEDELTPEEEERQANKENVPPPYVSPTAKKKLKPRATLKKSVSPRARLPLKDVTKAYVNKSLRSIPPRAESARPTSVLRSAPRDGKSIRFSMR